MEKLLAPKPFSCDLCGENFSRRSSMLQHKRMHTGEKPYHCDICLKTFTRPYSLQKHQCSHTGEKPFSCDLCGHKFSRSSTLLEHKRTHAGEKPFQCDICQEYFSRRTTLNQHQRTHSGEKPYVCNVCGKRFTRRYTLQNHTKDHSGEAPYSCNVCGQRFSRPLALQKHQRFHSGQKQYTCDVCGENFSRRSNLHVHQRTHTGEKPFNCTICGKLFSRRSNLQVHERGHSGIKPYKCDVCGKRFVRNSTLTKHKQHHVNNQKGSLAEKRPDRGIDPNPICSNTGHMHNVHGVCNTYGANSNQKYISQQCGKYSNHIDGNTNTTSNELYKARSNDDNSNLGLSPTHQGRTTGLPMEQKQPHFYTCYGSPAAGCNNLQTLSLASEELLHSQQQVPSCTSVPSKLRLSTPLTSRKWLEPPTVIVASSEIQREQLADNTCLNTSGTPWQRNIPTSLVSTPLCNTLVIMQSAPTLES